MRVFRQASPHHRRAAAVRGRLDVLQEPVEVPEETVPVAGGPLEDVPLAELAEIVAELFLPGFGGPAGRRGIGIDRSRRRLANLRGPAGDAGVQEFQQPLPALGLEALDHGIQRRTPLGQRLPAHLLDEPPEHLLRLLGVPDGESVFDPRQTGLDVHSGASPFRTQ